MTSSGPALRPVTGDKAGAGVSGVIYMSWTIYIASDILRAMNISPEALFGMLANPTRLRCLLLLRGHQELCVCELTHVIGAAQPNVSRHLAQLREAQLVLDRREGQWIYYRLNPALPAWVSELLRAAADGATGFPPYADDRATLARMPNRPGAPRCA